MNFRYKLIPGDIGYLARLHGILYNKEYGYDNTFEAYVARGLAEFVLNHDPDKERIWLAEEKGEIIACIAIVRYSEDTAQLRWYLVHPDHRGKGLGKQLISEAVGFCKDKKYRRIFLWTTNELKSAAYLYTQQGFVKTEEKSHMIWGAERTEERYELDLSLRTILHKLNNDDFEHYFSLYGNADVMRLITGRAYSKDEALRKFEIVLKINRKNKATGYFGIYLKETQDFIGIAKIVKIRRTEAELGYVFLPEFWGQGFGSEISRHLIEYSRNIGSIKSLIAIIDPENHASKKILVKCGFLLEKEGLIDGLPGEIYRIIL